MEIGRTRERPPELIDEMRQVSGRVRELEETIRNLEAEVNDLLLGIPNMPLDDVPEGADESANVVVRTEGEAPQFDFEPLPHWELGERLGIIDFQRGAKMAGSRFFVLKGKGARLQRALIDWMLDTHTGEHGYTELYLPNVVTTESARANSNLPKFADTMYRDDEDDLWLLPTAEMAITNMHRDEILPPDALPLQYVAHTPCFRREKAAAGRDTRGIKRVHQFEKVEMYRFVEPGQVGGRAAKYSGSSRKDLRRLGHTLSPAGTLCRRPRLPVCQDLRHRDVGARLRRVAGGQLMLYLHRLSGAAGCDTLPPGAWRKTALRAYAERVGACAASRDNRHSGELSAGGWFGGDTGGAEGVHGV